MSIIDMVASSLLNGSKDNGMILGNSVSAYEGNFHILIENEIRNKADRDCKENLIVAN